MITLFQIIIVLFGLFALSRVLLRYKKKEISNHEFLFWLFVWLIVILFGVLPSLSTLPAKWFGISGGTNLLIYVSVIVLFYLVFRLYVKLEKMDQNITKLVREIAKERKK